LITLIAVLIPVIAFILGLLLLRKSWRHLKNTVSKENREPSFLMRGYGVFGFIVALLVGLWFLLISFYGATLAIQVLSR
jgi:amino acid transporter